MRKGLKVLSISLLLSTLVLAGCSCDKKDLKNVSKIENNADGLLGNLTDEASKYTLQDVYNALIASDTGNKVIADKLVEFIGNEVLKLNDSKSEWKPRFDALIEEKLKEKAESSDYLVQGEFSEKYMIDALKAEGYAITCAAGVDYGTVDNLACDYTDYINKSIKNSVISTLLKEKYIIDESIKDRKNLLTNKKIRDVEYFSVSSSLESTYADLNVRDFMRSLRDKIANGDVVDFADVEKSLRDELKAIVKTEFDKIGTKDDYNQSIASSYTNSYTQTAEVGYNKKLETIDNTNFAYNKLIGSDSSSTAVVSANITSTLLSITNPTSADFAKKVVAVKDANDVTHYYLIHSQAETNTEENKLKGILLPETSDSSTYTYSIVRFSVINSDTVDADDIYQAAKLLASESTLASGALAHYVKEYKDSISVYDDDVYTYLSSLYPDVFTE